MNLRDKLLQIFTPGSLLSTTRGRIAETMYGMVWIEYTNPHIFTLLLTSKYTKNQLCRLDYNLLMFQISDYSKPVLPNGLLLFCG